MSCRTGVHLLLHSFSDLRRNRTLLLSNLIPSQARVWQEQDWQAKTSASRTGPTDADFLSFLEEGREYCFHEPGFFESPSFGLFIGFVRVCSGFSGSLVVLENLKNNTNRAGL